MDPLKIIQKYYDKNSKTYKILIAHGENVKNKAFEIAAKHPELKLNLKFISEAAMLHDIGAFRTNWPNIDCFGDLPKIQHGVIGREILEKEGFPKHALVCERHVGLGLSTKDIEKSGLPLPRRDMKPVSIEEQLICFADNFFSKKDLFKEKTIDEIKNKLLQSGVDRVKLFDDFLRKFG